MSRSPHRHWKGCCLMCAMNGGKVRGKERDSHSAADMRRLGKKRRFGNRREEWDDA